MVDYLGLKNDPEVRVYDDGLFFFKDGPKRTDTYIKIRRFFEQEDFSDARALMEKIVRIPFHFIITTTPDNLLVETFQSLHFNVKSTFYWPNHSEDPNMAVPSQACPMVYNMLGNLKNRESLVLTHDDLFTYLGSIFQDKSMPVTLRSAIKDSLSLIFLGIPFDRWYMQVVLRMLGLHEDKNLLRFAILQESSEEVLTLCKDEFRINFVPKKIDVFIDKIYSLCECEGILRTPQDSPKLDAQKLKTLLEEDHIDDAFRQFNEFLKSIGEAGMELAADLTLLFNRNSRLKRKITQGIISQEETNLQENKLRSDLLALLQEAEVLT